MYRVALINMPFASADIPSIALTQLKAALQQEAGDGVECEIFYLNLDFVKFLGLPLYEVVSNSVEANTSGMGDWFFSKETFPEQEDQTDLYLARHFSEHRAQLDVFKRTLIEKRRTVGLFLEELIRRHALDRYSLVGFTSMFSQNVASFAMAKRLKRRNPDIRIAMGGANCEAPMGNVIVRNVPWVDFVFSGPGLKNFPLLVNHLRAGEEEECHRITGVLTRKKLASQLLGSGREIGEELDIDLDLPLEYEDYFEQSEGKLPGTQLNPKIPFETSRGCWWGERSHCTFCGLNGVSMKYRSMAAEKSLNLLHGLFEKYSSRSAEFKSVDNILPREYLTDVLPYLRTPEHTSIFYEVKADLKEREMQVLEQARVTKIQPGIEAMSTTTLKLMRKGTTAFQNIKFLKYCLNSKVKPFWNLLVGFPDEPEEVYRKYYEDLPLLMHLEPPSGAYPVRFDRFSPYHMRAREYGLELKACDFYSMIYPFPAEELNDLAYFFTDQNYNAPYITTTARWLGKLRERVETWQTRWNARDHGLAPQLIFKGDGEDRHVYDSRSGTAVEHRPGRTALRLLDALADQRRLSRLTEDLAADGISESAVQEGMAALRECGLLFEENGIFMSLVVSPSQEDSLAAISGEASRSLTPVEPSASPVP
jgi:ribosomal peptide maturation radical SAM protein 1